MKFIYTGHCAAGSVRFQRNDEVVEMPEGEAVEVPEWLAKKLENNSHFEREDEEIEEPIAGTVEQEEAPRRRGRPPKARE